MHTGTGSKGANMKNFINAYWKVILFFVLAGILGGFFVGLYTLDSYPQEVQQQILAQGITPTILGLVSAVQSAGYGLVLGILGILLSKKVGLWKDQVKFEKKPILFTILVAGVGGFAMIGLDVLFFGNYSQAIADSYAVKPTVPYLLASVTYGAIIEEVMLRLFMMSLIAFVLHRLFGRKKTDVSAALLVAANILSALLFAAGHLPATAVLLGLSPMIIFRCFLLNGGLGLLFGWLYRKYGLHYAMLAHGGCHLVSKVIWVLFL